MFQILGEALGFLSIKDSLTHMLYPGRFILIESVENDLAKSLELEGWLLDLSLRKTV